MTKFIDLIEPIKLKKTGGSWEADKAAFSQVGQSQRDAAERFPEMAKRHGFSLWRPDDLKVCDFPLWQRNGVKSCGFCLVIGISTASRIDLSFLDEVEIFLPRIKAVGGSVRVFNTYYFQTQNEFEERIPSIGTVYHTPVVGVWQETTPSQNPAPRFKVRELKWTASGFEAREKVRQFLNQLPELEPEETQNRRREKLPLHETRSELLPSV